jgi:branched-chain amino acid transport system permease protein
MAMFGANEILIQSTLTNGLLALSLLVVLRVGAFSFTGIAAYGLSAYVTAIAGITWGWGTTMSILAGVVVSMVLCALLAPILRGLNGLAMGLATMAVVLIVGVAVVNGGTTTGGPQGLFGVPATVRTGTAILLVAVLLAILTITEVGPISRLIEAVRADRELSVSNGIPVERVRFVAIVASGLIGGLGGALAASFRSIVTPADLQFGQIILALTIIIVGGFGSWVGALIGAVLFTWLPTVLTSVGEWQAVIYGLIVAGAAMWMPEGLIGLGKNAWRRSGLQWRPSSLTRRVLTKTGEEAVE